MKKKTCCSPSFFGLCIYPHSPIHFNFSLDKSERTFIEFKQKISAIIRKFAALPVPQLPHTLFVKRM